MAMSCRKLRGTEKAPATVLQPGLVKKAGYAMKPSTDLNHVRLPSSALVP